MEIPSCEFPFGAKVVVKHTHKYSGDFPEVFVISGIEWHHSSTRWRSVENDQANITLIPQSDLKDGGTDGFTPDDLRLATDQEIADDRRGAA